MAVGTVTITTQSQLDKTRRPVSKYSLAWTSDASGNVSGTLTDFISGVIGRVSFIPGAGGVQPTDLYDVTLYDEDGVSILGGVGANRSNATPSHACPGVPLSDGTTTETLPVMVDGRLELRVANAGNAKAGVVTIYVR